ncbi:MAG TPA: hypothetical protein VGH07_07920 [Chthoniobacterales bacterium]
MSSSPLTFERALRRLAVNNSWDTLVRGLVEEEVDPALLEFWLRDIIRSSDRLRSKNRDRRRASRLVKSAKKLAKELELAIKSPPLAFFGSSSDIQVMLSLPPSLPGNLIEYARVWEKLLSIRWPTGTTSERTDKIWAMLGIINEVTSAYHYSEVADVLNAMDMAMNGAEAGQGWNAMSLKQLQYRARKRMKPLLKKQKFHRHSA